MAAVNGSERCVEYILEAHPESLNAVDKHQVTELTYLCQFVLCSNTGLSDCFDLKHCL